MRMDRVFTPQEDRPRSTPEPLPSYPNQSCQPTENVAAVQPVSGQVSSDADSMERNEPGNTVLGSTSSCRGGSSSGGAGSGRREIFHPVVVNNEASCGGGGEEREENGRPNSAPARTPNSSDGAIYAGSTASMNRPRNTRPHASIIGSELDGEIMPSLDPLPGSRHEQAGSSNSAESSEQQESFLQQYSELSPGPSGEPRYVCHFCTFSTDALQEMRAHLMRHGDDFKMKCTQCGYSTEERTQFRRHKRQHQRTNPTSMLHCDKCQFSTPTPRRMREHYSFQHNEDMASTFPSAAAASSVLMRSSAFNSTPGGFGRLAYGSDTSYYTVNLTGRGLNSYRPLPPRNTLQFDPGTPSSSIISGCVNGGFTQPIGFPAFRNQNDRRGIPVSHPTPLSELTLEYFLGPRVTASSTITSCEYPARPSNPHRPDLNNFSPLRGSTSGSRDTFARQTPGSPTRGRCSLTMHEGDGVVKVKTEPIDCDGVSDVSSSGVPGLFERGGPDPDRPQRSMAPETTTTHSRYRRPLFEATSSPHRVALEQSDEIATSAGDMSRVSQSSEAASSHMDTRAGSVEDSEQEERRESGRGGNGIGGDSLGQHLLFNIKAETSSVAVQCSGSSSTMKSETLPLVTVAAAEHSTESRQHHRTVERGVQCEILSPPHRRITTSRNLSTDSEQHESVSGSDTRCMHCGIMFEDEVIFSIHLGCHSHTDPFVCNVCGKKCHNKYGFYSHIMRGHHL